MTSNFVVACDSQPAAAVDAETCFFGADGFVETVAAEIAGFERAFEAEGVVGHELVSRANFDCRNPVFAAA